MLGQRAIELSSGYRKHLYKYKENAIEGRKIENRRVIKISQKEIVAQSFMFLLLIPVLKTDHTQTRRITASRGRPPKPVPSKMY